MADDPAKIDDPGVLRKEEFDHLMTLLQRRLDTLPETGTIQLNVNKKAIDSLIGLAANIFGAIHSLEITLAEEGSGNREKAQEQLKEVYGYRVRVSDYFALALDALLKEPGSR